MSDHDPQISELAEKAKAGHRASLESLISLFHHDIFRLAFYRTRSRMDAEDLTQEIFMQMIKSLPGLKEAERFKPWLYRIAVNRIKDFHRKKSILSFFGTAEEMETSCPVIAEDAENPLNRIIRKEFLEQFYSFTDSLSRWEQEVFMLRFAEQLGIKEIAEALNKNENTVKTHLYRALKKFKEHAGLLDILKGETL